MHTPVILSTLYIDRFLKQFVVNCNQIVGIYSLLCGWFCSVQDHMQKKPKKNQKTKKNQPKKNGKKTTTNKQKPSRPSPKTPIFYLKLIELKANAIAFVTLKFLKFREFKTCLNCFIPEAHLTMFDTNDCLYHY